MEIYKSQGEYMEKAKKRKIITAILCGVMILVGIIASIILLTQKKFDISANSEPYINEHTNIRVVKPQTGMSIAESEQDSTPKYYSNGTVSIKSNATGKYGIYSFIDDKTIIPAEYGEDDIEPVKLDSSTKSTGEYIFKVKKQGNGEISFVTDKGVNTEITVIDQGKTYGCIKEKIIEVQQKRKGVKVKDKKDFISHKIEISDAEYVGSYIKDGEYNYECWVLTDADKNVYTNLYSVSEGKRKLIQTLNNPIGNPSNIADENSSFYFLSDGTPMISTSRNEYDSEHNYNIIIDTYDINFKHKNSATLKVDDTLKNRWGVQVGDSIFYQYIIPSTEDNYDYSDIVTTSEGSTTNYYLVKTHKLNMKTGKLKEVKFKYVIESSDTGFNPETALIKARKITSKTLDNEVILLVNDKLQTKKIDFDIDSIYQVNDDRYIVENSVGQYLIDEHYNLISYLGDFNSFFTTDEAILLSDKTNTYVCSLDGVVVKTYQNNEVINAYHDTYYIVKETQEVDGVVTNKQYLEKVGIRGEQIYLQQSDRDSYTYNGVSYVGYSVDIFEDGVSIITRVRKVNDSRFAYEFYNVDGDLLYSLDNFETGNRTLEWWGYTDDNHSILYISTNVGGEGYYLVVNR